MFAWKYLIVILNTWKFYLFYFKKNRVLVKVHIYCIIFVWNLCRILVQHLICPMVLTFYGTNLKVDLGHTIEKWFSLFKVDLFQITNLNEYYIPYGKEIIYGFFKLSKNIKIFTMLPYLFHFFFEEYLFHIIQNSNDVWRSWNYLRVVYP